MRCLLERGCSVTVYPAETPAEEIIADAPDGIMLTNGPGDPKDNVKTIEEIKKLFANEDSNFRNLSWTSASGACKRCRYTEDEIWTSWSKSSGKGFKDREGIYFNTESWLCGKGRDVGS